MRLTLAPVPHPGAPVLPPPRQGARAPGPDLPNIVPPMLTIALPDTGQVQIPGTAWAAPDIWAASERRVRAGAPPAIEIRQLTRKESNQLAEGWHPLGAETRPFGYHAFALFVQGEPLALATAGTTHSAIVDKDLGLHRRNVIELTRLCRSSDERAKGTLRVMLRLWRDFLAVPYWPYFENTEKIALVSYSMPGKPGHVYRTDGWARARGCKSSGGGGTWSGPSRLGSVAPEGLWVYWLRGKPANLAAVLAKRQQDWDALLERRRVRARKGRAA